MFQPVQGFDYAKQHLGQLGADEDSAPLPQAPPPIRDASLSLSMDKVVHPDGTNFKKTLSGDIRKRLLEIKIFIFIKVIKDILV